VPWAPVCRRGQAVHTWRCTGGRRPATRPRQTRWYSALRGSLIPTPPFVQFFVAFVHKINLADVCRVNDYGKVADKIWIYAHVWRQLLENLDELGWTYPFASVVFHGGDGME